MKLKFVFLLALNCCAFFIAVNPVRAQSTAFTYQGRLNLGGVPVNGSYDFQFAVYDNSTTGTRQGAVITDAGTVVSNGLFTVVLDFGNVFPGADRWLDISVRTNGGGSFTTLAPRQQLSPIPYALTAGSMPAGAITSNMLGAGAVTSDKIAAGSVKGYQIDDGGEAAYEDFRQAAQSLGGQSSLTFSNLFPVSATNGINPSFGLTINGATFGSVVGFAGSEGMSQPYSFTVEVLYSGAAVDPDSHIGLPGRLTFTRNTHTTSFGGIVTGCSLSSSNGTGLFYTFRLESPLAFLALTTDSAVYQNLTSSGLASSIYHAVTGSNAVLHLSSSYTAHESLMQYAEPSLNFFNRLLEYEGVFYFFDQSAAVPNLTLGDAAASYPAAPNSPFSYFGNTTTNIPAGAEYVRTFQKAFRQSTLKSTVNSYDFKLPTTSLINSSTALEGTGEEYEFGTPVQTPAYTTQLAQLRKERFYTERATMSGAGNVPDLRPGYTFTLTDRTGTGLGSNYVVTAARHAGFIRVTNGVSSLFYGNQFEVIPAVLNYRPPQATPKPQARSSSAEVTGPAGESIYVDSYGRVKVQFHWDRTGKKDQNSSAWIRVASPMAGPNHGMMFLPQVGDEVMVSFLEGDPDQPVIIGSLYNGVATPPYALPGNKAISTIQSIATDNGVNEVAFNDAAGAQTLTVHGAKDLLLQANRLISLGKGVSINGGTVFTNFLAGQAIAGSSTNYQTNFPIAFPKSFVSAPKVVATAASDPAWNVGDTFVTSVRSVTTTGFVVNIVRVDSTAGWSQALRVNWIAWE